MRNLERYPDQNPNVVIFDELGIIYGQKLLRRIIDTGQTIEVVTVRGIDIETLHAYLKVHFPNYASVQAIEEVDEIKPEHLEAISDAIQLTVGDAMYMRDLQLAAAREGGIE